MSEASPTEPHSIEVFSPRSSRSRGAMPQVLLAHALP